MRSRHTKFQDCSIPLDFIRASDLFPQLWKCAISRGDWDAVGRTRTLMLSDGGHVVETITDTEVPELFGMLVSGGRGTCDMYYRRSPERSICWLLGRKAGCSVEKWPADATVQSGYQIVVILEPFTLRTHRFHNLHKDALVTMTLCSDRDL